MDLRILKLAADFEEKLKHLFPSEEDNRLGLLQVKNEIQEIPGRIFDRHGLSFFKDNIGRLFFVTSDDNEFVTLTDKLEDIIR